MKPDFAQIAKLPDDAVLTVIETARILGFTSAGIIKKLKRGSIKGVRVASKWYVMGKEIKSQVISSEMPAVNFLVGE